MSTEEQAVRKEADDLRASVYLDADGRIRIVIPPKQNDKYPCVMNTVFEDTSWATLLVRIHNYVRFI